MSPVIAEEIAAALAGRRPVVALESTLIAHGFPWPENLEVGHDLEATVRKAGAVPATIALADGAIRVGLDSRALERLARGGAIKCSTRDLGAVLAQGGLGATTVAATARIAASAGIRVFATGGIGGVHRGEGGDVSADLIELSRAPIAVVSAGAKIVLDLPATFEALETLGVPVYGFGCDEFPGFYVARSGLGLDHRFDDVGRLARAVTAHLDLGLGGVLVCQPPPEDLALSGPEIEGMMTQALARAAAEGVRGKAVTPHLLKSLAVLSDGRTIACNRALALANASLAARLAKAICA
ncbi:MAG: pseudouridine-5'-phosphate glycosidase [Alphaproteobacteria bacterium]|nr:pseudouridine-5'-phosphate glycosidase [Alphaproteobacteria bacterium]